LVPRPSAAIVARLAWTNVRTYIRPSSRLVFRELRNHEDVPLRPRLTPGGEARPAIDPCAGGAPAKASVVSPADRGVLSGRAEHVRESCGLRYVAIFRYAAGSHTAIEELARASLLDVEEMGRVRTAGHAAVRGMRRFARRAVALEGGIHVVAAEAVDGEVAAVIAVGAPGAGLPTGANAALVDLAQVAARVLSDPGKHGEAAPGDTGRVR